MESAVKSRLGQVYSLEKQGLSLRPPKRNFPVFFVCITQCHLAVPVSGGSLAHFCFQSEDVPVDFRERGREGEREERYIDVRGKRWLVAFRRHPNQGSNLQPRHVPRPGIEPITTWFAQRCPTNRTAQTKADWFLRRTMFFILIINDKMNLVLACAYVKCYYSSTMNTLKRFSKKAFMITLK